MNEVTGGLRIPGLSAEWPRLSSRSRGSSRHYPDSPGVGPKTAQRLTYHLLRAPEAEARALAAALIAVRDEVVYCESCFNISTGPLCPICADPSRDQSRVCVVEEPLRRVWPWSASGAFRGRYHVLHGAISPMDGVGPDRLRVRELLDRASCAADGEPYEEVVLATNPTLEGEATAMYLAERLHGPTSGSG